MKKIVLIFILIFLAAKLYASPDNLYEAFKDYYEIKVFLKDVINETEDSNVKTDVFKKVFKDVLTERVNINFIPVDNEKDADVIVISRIKDYVFTERALPMRAAPFFIIAVTIIADTAEPKSAAKLIVDYEIRRPEDNKAIFSYKNLTTEARQIRENMKGEMGYIHALRENINRFIFRAFYERKSR